MIENLAVDETTRNYLEDIEHSARLFEAAQRLSYLSSTQSETELDPKDVSNITEIDSTGPCLLRQVDDGRFVIEQLDENPIPVDDRSRDIIWVPRIKFNVSEILRAHRPTGFEVEDLILRYQERLFLPGERPFGQEMFRPSLSNIPGYSVTPAPAKPFMAIVGPEFKHVNLNQNADNVFQERPLSYRAAEGLLGVIEELTQQTELPTEPYLHDIIVGVEEVRPFDSLTEAVQDTTIVSQYGNWPYGKDQSRFVYDRISELASQGHRRVVLARTMDEIGRLCAFRIAIPRLD
jgi:hypothetical protein